MVRCTAMIGISEKQIYSNKWIIITIKLRTKYFIQTCHETSETIHVVRFTV